MRVAPGVAQALADDAKRLDPGRAERIGGNAAADVQFDLTIGHDRAMHGDDGFQELWERPVLLTGQTQVVDRPPQPPPPALERRAQLASPAPRWGTARERDCVREFLERLVVQ